MIEVIGGCIYPDEVYCDALAVKPRTGLSPWNKDDSKYVALLEDRLKQQRGDAEMERLARVQVIGECMFRGIMNGPEWLSGHIDELNRLESEEAA